MSEFLSFQITLNYWWTVNNEVKTYPIKALYNYGQRGMNIPLMFQGNAQKLEFEFNNNMIEMKIYKAAYQRLCGKVLYMEQENRDTASLSVL